jgi:hypothetical protein
MSLTSALKGVIFAVSSGRKHDHEQMGGALGGTHDVTTDQRTNHDGRDAMRRPRLP